MRRTACHLPKTLIPGTFEVKKPPFRRLVGSGCMLFLNFSLFILRSFQKGCTFGSFPRAALLWSLRLRGSCFVVPGSEQGALQEKRPGLSCSPQQVKPMMCDWLMLWPLGDVRPRQATSLGPSRVGPPAPRSARGSPWGGPAQPRNVSGRKRQRCEGYTGAGLSRGDEWFFSVLG